MNRLLIFFLIIISLCSCSTESGVDTSLDSGYNYFPIHDIGTTYIYEVDRIFYNNQGKETEHLVTYERNVVIESTKDGDNLGSYREEIWESNTGQEPWLYKENMVSETNELQAICSKSGNRIIKLTFPVAEGKSWDGLALMNDVTGQIINGESIDFYKDWDFKILGYENFEAYNDVLTVQQANHENAIEKRYSMEKYAMDIGLVYKEQQILDTQCLLECNDQNWEEKAHHGIILKKRLISIN